MSGPSFIEPTPIDIGVTPKPPFAVTPDPKTLFAKRADRFRELAPGHPLEDYLGFLAELTQIQDDIQDGLPEPKLPPDELIERSFEFGMPPLDRGRFEPDEATLMTLSRLLDKAVALKMPEPAAAARDRLAGDGQAQARVLAEALENAASVETLADHVFASAALQVHFARLAARLDASRLAPVGVGACPCCGGPPVASLVVGWTAAHGARFVACALCCALWNHVRVKCVACDSTEGIGYQALAPDGETVEPASENAKRRDREPVKAETCEACKCYVKIFHQHIDPNIDPVADDVASLGLDLKVREAGWARAAFNPYLLGY